MKLLVSVLYCFTVVSYLTVNKVAYRPNCITQVNGTSVVADEEPFGKKAKISIVINEERYDCRFLAFRSILVSDVTF